MDCSSTAPPQQMRKGIAAKNESGFPPLLAAAAALVAVPLAAGIFRVTSHLPMNLSLALAAVIVLPALTGVVVRYPMRAHGISTSPLALLLAAAASTLFVLRMYHPNYFGLPSVGGGDAGNHVHWGREFLDRNPAIYHGLVYFYSMTYWSSLFGLDDSFSVFRAAFYLTSILSLFIVSVLAVEICSSDSKRIQAVSTLLLVALFALPAERIIFPSFHYLQADGFYPQVASISVLLLAAAFYVLTEPRLLRVTLLLSGVVMYRYSYALNLGDALIASAVVLAIEAKSEPKSSLSKMYATLSVGAVLLALYCYSRLLPVIELEGAIITVDHNLILKGLLMLCVGMLAAIFSANHITPVSRRLLRLLWFTSSYVFSGVIFQIFYKLYGPSDDYYLQKYFYHETVLSVCAVIIAAAVLLPELVHSLQGRSKLKTAAISASLIFAFFGMWSINTALQPIRVSYQERAAKVSSAKTLMPLSDPFVLEKVTESLNKTGKSFGGFLTPIWPESNFVNSDLGLYGQLSFYRTGKAGKDDGRCVFWMSAPHDLAEFKRVGGSALLKRLNKLADLHGVRKVSYSVPWSTVRQELSSVCFSEELRNVQPQ
ncbi:MAG: hypothetical protein KDD66_18280 [Bdellovibrionales bacterium]|nr:hypothetical protein [Bdellovibrionales bacterium]